MKAETKVSERDEKRRAEGTQWQIRADRGTVSIQKKAVGGEGGGGRKENWGIFSYHFAGF